MPILGKLAIAAALEFCAWGVARRERTQSENPVAAFEGFRRCKTARRYASEPRPVPHMIMKVDRVSFSEL
jgi:hypothetical protein